MESNPELSESLKAAQQIQHRKTPPKFAHILTCFLGFRMNTRKIFPKIKNHHGKKLYILKAKQITKAAITLNQNFIFISN